MCQANLDTATWVISAVVAMPPSTRRGGLLAWTIAPSQVRQAYFGKIVLFTRTKAGTTSRASRVSSPIRCSAPEQQGQTVTVDQETTAVMGLEGFAYLYLSDPLSSEEGKLAVCKFVRNALASMGACFTHRDKAERILRGAQWLAGSYMSRNETLAFVQAMVAMEILLGDK